MPEAVRLDVHDAVGTLTLNRPDALNGIDEEVLTALASLLPAIADNDQIKALVITGTGPAFCVGLDIDLLGRAFSDAPYFQDVLQRFNATLLDLESLPIPTVAKVNGLARAGGFELLLACDLVVVSEAARIGDTHLAFGVVPGGGATQRAVRKLGWQRACDIIFTGRWLSAKEAVAVGLALRHAPADELDQAVAELTSVFAAQSRSCLASTKAAMREGLALELKDALKIELHHFMDYLTNDEHSREGYLAFVEGRQPTWP